MSKKKATKRKGGDAARSTDGLGEQRLQQIKEMMQERGYKIPMSEWEAIGLRGCGRMTLRELIKIGWVTESPASELSSRAAHCLSNVGIETKEQARQAITQGRLKPDKKPWKWNSTNEDRGVRNYGWKTHKEVCKWAGLPEPQKPKRMQICPHCGKDVLCLPNKDSATP